MGSKKLLKPFIKSFYNDVAYKKPTAYKKITLKTIRIVDNELILIVHFKNRVRCIIYLYY